MAHMPLSDGSLSCGVFCLSLMGTNYSEFIREAHRVIKVDGVLIVAEIKSRISSLEELKDGMRSAGFRCIKLKKCKDYFIIAIFRRVEANNRRELPALKPCMYKKR